MTRRRATETDDGATAWEQIGRRLAAQACDRRRGELEDAFYELAEVLHGGGDPTPEDIRRARHALNDAYRLVEDQLAPIAGAEPWEIPPPIPMGVLWELTEHPKAEGVDPREYVDAEALPGSDEGHGGDDE